MAYTRKTIDGKEIERQQAICADIFERVTADGGRPLALVDTYGCQQNEADSEKLRGYLAEMGYGFTQDEFQADVIVVNTCAVREHAEMRVLGNVGALNHSKKARPGQIIAVCGCMVQQEHMAQKIKMSYPVVDLVFGPHELWRFPELLLEVMEKHKRVFAAEKNDGAVAEGIPVRRDGKVKAWLSIMYGCNNFCTYCIVPYVRGRERSRLPEDVVAEARELVAAGYKDITLLGQNVNSYGKDLDCGVDFADLIRMINAIPGDFRIRFMTSHPRDATEKLFCTMAACEKCAHHIHLPVQSGSDRILKQMNRHYDRAKYLSEIETAMTARSTSPKSRRPAAICRTSSSPRTSSWASPARRRRILPTRSRCARPCASTRCSPSSIPSASARLRRACPTPIRARTSRSTSTRSRSFRTVSPARSTGNTRERRCASSSTARPARRNTTSLPAQTAGGLSISRAIPL